MKIQFKRLNALMLGLVLLFTLGCTSAPKVTNSGFLADYSKLTDNDPLGYSRMVYLNKNLDLKKYDSFMLDEVTFFLKEDAEYKGIPASELTEISAHFYKAIVKEVSTLYTHTDKPGPGVIRFRFAVTDLVPTKPVQSGMTTVVPVGLVVSAGAKVTTGVHIGMGGASFEAEALDSVTNEVLASAIDAKTGKKYKVTKNFTKWAQVKDICNEWAENLRKRMEIILADKE